MRAHADGDLLALCAELRLLQEEWQRLWDETPDIGGETPADLAWQSFSNRTWPGYRANPAADPVALLRDLPASTPDGLRAKAAALKAIVDADGYTGCCRDDEGPLISSLLEDAAGCCAMPIGEDAHRENDHVTAG